MAWKENPNISSMFLAGKIDELNSVLTYHWILVESSWGFKYWCSSSHQSLDLFLLFLRADLVIQITTSANNESLTSCSCTILSSGLKFKPDSLAVVEWAILSPLSQLCSFFSLPSIALAFFLQYWDIGHLSHNTNCCLHFRMAFEEKRAAILWG